MEIDAEANEVIVGLRDALACEEVHLSDVNWINAMPDDGGGCFGAFAEYCSSNAG